MPKTMFLQEVGLKHLFVCTSDSIFDSRWALAGRRRIEQILLGLTGNLVTIYEGMGK